MKEFHNFYTYLTDVYDYRISFIELFATKYLTSKHWI